MKSLLKLSLTAFCLLLSIRVLVAQEPGTCRRRQSRSRDYRAAHRAADFVAMWKVFTKAGQPGWASIIPHLQSLHLVQDRRPAMVVDSVDAHSFG